MQALQMAVRSPRRLSIENSFNLGNLTCILFNVLSTGENSLIRQNV